MASKKEIELSTENTKLRTHIRAQEEIIQGLEKKLKAKNKKGATKKAAPKKSAAKKK